LVQAINEAHVTVDNHTHTLPQPFMVLATQNPVEHHGTYPLPESQLDRFLLRIGMGYPSRESEREIMRQHTGGRNAAAEVTAVMEAKDVETMQRAVENVRVDDSLRDYAIDIVDRTRRSEQLTLGVSPRGLLMLQRAAQARAFLEGRDFCTPDDFKQLILPVFAHRVVVNTRYATTQKKLAQVEAILRDIIETTRVPL
jgi:MoxR-like ATPase